MYELCAPVFCCSAGHTVGDHVGKTWFRISLHNKSSKKSAFQSTMEHLTYLDIRDTFALIMVRPLKYVLSHPWVPKNEVSAWLSKSLVCLS